MVTTAAALRPDTADRILVAVFRRISDVGLGRTTVEDVAREAGLTRQTVYRYFPSKDSLVTALVLREEERFLDGVRAAFAEAPGLEPALHRGILFCLRFAREHPLLERLLDTDAGTLLPYLTLRGGPLVGRAREVLTSLIARTAWVDAGLLEAVADTLARAVISHTLTRSERPPEDVARDLARIATAALGRPKEARR